jgi:CDP-diacylglycerol---glycerol-3-phosphate 3-phosphatidyltransferase
VSLLGHAVPEPEERGGETARPVLVPRVPLLNLANVLTCLRIALVPVFAVLLLADGTAARYAALGVFIVAGVTDRIDGQIARSRGLVTRFGTVADPLADKALIGAALIGLSILGELWWWVTIVVVGREIAISLLRLYVVRHGSLPSSRGGKLKTMLQGVAIGVLLLPVGGVVQVAGVVLMTAAVAVTLATAVDYALRAHRLLRDSERTASKRARRQVPPAGAA